MSDRTIKMLNFLCHVGNWNEAIKGVAESPALEPGAPAVWKLEAKCEIKRWTAMRDRDLATLRATVAALTPEDLDLVRREYEPAKLAEQLLEVGVAPRW